MSDKLESMNRDAPIGAPLGNPGVSSVSSDGGVTLQRGCLAGWGPTGMALVAVEKRRSVLSCMLAILFATLLAFSVSARALAADAPADSQPANAWNQPSNEADTSSWLEPSPTTAPDTKLDWMHPFQEAVVPFDNWVNDALSWVVDNFRPVFQVIRVPIDATLGGVEKLLTAMPDILIIIVITLLALFISGRRLAVGTLVALVIVGIIGAWTEAMVTLALVVTSVFFCILLGLPLGIWLSQNDRALQTVRPILDAMQTTPAFVYLVPIVMLFGIGNVPGVVVTIIFALPPLVRLTNLGIRQVPTDLVEAATAFGANRRQVMFKVRLPLALPTIMAGVNQTGEPDTDACPFHGRNRFNDRGWRAWTDGVTRHRPS